MKTFDLVVYIILLVGALNWGLVGLFDFDLIAAIFGEMAPVSRIIYVIVGLAAIYDIVAAKAIWKRWDVHLKKPAAA